MGDIADILGFQAKPVQDEASKIFADKPKLPKSGKKPKGMSREVFDLVGNDSIAPAMQPNNVTPGFKTKRSTVLKGKWIWDIIRNSAREDGKLALYHWVKADMHYSDYPYAKFNVKLDELTINSEDYNILGLSDPFWTYEETVALMQTCTRYDLRWPIIHDKLALSHYKRVEDLQARYYHVVAQLRQAQTGACGSSSESGPGATARGTESSKFNFELESARRKAQDQLFRK